MLITASSRLHRSVEALYDIEVEPPLLPEARAAQIQAGRKELQGAQEAWSHSVRALLKEELGDE